MGAKVLRNRILAAVLPFLMAAGATAAETAGFKRPGLSRKADPALSARFLPARLLAEDAAQVERFRSLARGFAKDSTRHFRASGRTVEVTHDLLAAMAVASGAQAPRGASGLAALLALRHGLSLKAGGAAHGAYVPDDKWYKASPQWALKNEGKAVEGMTAKAGVDIGMERVWDRFAGADTLVVAVLDAGFAFRHPDLAGRQWVNRAEAAGRPGVDDDANGFVDDSTGWDFVDNDAVPEDMNGHGTFISGVLAAGFDDGRGIAGMLAQGKVMPVRVLDAVGSGDHAEIAEGIRYALANGADVINFSIGGGGGSTALRDAFRAARDKGVPIVAAAGNEGLDVDAEAVFPSSFDYGNLVVVGSHGPDGSPSSFSNHGSRVHLSAPGEAVLTCGIPDRVEIWTEGFEDAAPPWTLSGFSFSAASPLDGTRSLAWSSGTAATAVMADTLDLTGHQGGSLLFGLEFTPADGTDHVIVEGNRIGSSTWTEVAVIGEAVPAGTYVEFALRSLDGGKVRLRFRTQIGAGRSAAARRLRIDGLSISVAAPASASREIYVMVDGTSIAAPYVAAYVGLQRLACDRLGLAWTRSMALQGAAADPLLAGKSSTGGRLDAGKGLDFYLSTLPGLVVTDSTALTWTGGDKVEFSMAVDNPGGRAWRFAASGLQGLALDSALGKVSWVSQRPGSYSLKLIAEGPTQLRRRLALRILPPPPLAVRGGYAGILRLGNRVFPLPADALAPRNFLEVLGADAAGRTQILKRAWLPPEAFSVPLDIPGSAGRFPFLRVRLNGADLTPGN